MRINEGVKLIDNFNRVREFQEIEVGNDVISAFYREYKMEITPDDVKVIKKIDKIFTTKILPKSAIKKAIKGKAIMESIVAENKEMFSDEGE